VGGPTESTVHPTRLDEVRQVNATQHRLSTASTQDELSSSATCNKTDAQSDMKRQSNHN